MTRWILMAMLIAVGICVNTGCDEDDGWGFSLEGTELSVADIAGSWTATKAIFSRNADGPVMEVDVVDEGGSVGLQIQENGIFSITVAVAGESSETSTGKLGFDEDVLVISFDDDPDEWEFFGISHNEPALSIYGGPVYEAFDFDDDGVDEDANINFDFTRI